MTFNTGNPIGSTDARDLSDNAENFDKALGTLDATWTDRLGVTRDSFEGRLAKGSFYRVGDFATGYTLTNMRQTLQYSGHEYSWAGTFPKVVAAGATPATSGGIGAGAWVDRTDLTLRSELSSNDGAGLIGSMSYAQLRAYSGEQTTVNVWGIDNFFDGAAGVFRVNASDTTSPDNGGTIIVDSSGNRWYRVFSSRAVFLEWFGAKGDGVTDDTNAFNKLDAFLESNSSTAFNIILTKQYIVNPNSCTHAFGGSNARLISLYADGSSVSGGGKVIISPSFSYSSTAGSEYYWSVVQSFANDCYCSRIGFNGNGKNTASGYSSSVTNIRFQMFCCLGVSGTTQYTNNSCTECYGSDFGGQAVSIQYCDDVKVIRNTFYNHSGIAVSAGSNVQVAFNTSRYCFDAAIGINGCYGVTVAFNYVNTSSNGSGIDIVGCSDYEVCHNKIMNALGSGIWVWRSPHLSLSSSRGRIFGNTLTANCRYTGSPRCAEILLGVSVDDGYQHLDEIEVFDNKIYLDGSIGPTSDEFIVVGFGTRKVDIRNNKVYGTINSSNIIAQIMYACPYLTFSENEWLGGSSLLTIGMSATSQPTPFILHKNKLMALPVSSSYFNDCGVDSEDGFTVYRSERNITTTGSNIATITFTGSYDMVEIIVEAVQRNDAGILRQRILARGYSGNYPVVLSSVTEFSAGSNIPVVTTDVSTYGILKVKLASTTNTYITDYTVRVKCYRGLSMLFR